LVNSMSLQYPIPHPPALSSPIRRQGFILMNRVA
jgi:hypothetical protein